MIVREFSLRDIARDMHYEAVLSVTEISDFAHRLVFWTEGSDLD
jgi:hypothetical protein